MAVIATPNASASPGSAGSPRFPRNAIAVTPSNTDTFARPVTIYVGGAGDVTCTPAGGGTDVVVAAPGGGCVPFEVTAVKSTGTTATKLLALY